MIYVVDTDSLIALNRLYNPRFFEQLWQQLDMAIERGILVSTRFNLVELERKEDDEFFEEWKRNHSHMFLEVDEVAQEVVSDILTRFPDLIDPNSDMEQADPFLIAMAKVMDGIVITEEGELLPDAINNPKRKKKMRIPNVCRYYGIESMKIHEFINTDEWRRTLQQ